MDNEAIDGHYDYGKVFIASNNRASYPIIIGEEDFDEELFEESEDPLKISDEDVNLDVDVLDCFSDSNFNEFDDDDKSDLEHAPDQEPNFEEQARATTQFLPLPESYLPYCAADEFENVLEIDPYNLSFTNDQLSQKTNEQNKFLQTSSDDDKFFDCKSTASEDKENKFIDLTDGDGASELGSFYSNSEFEEGDTSESYRYIEDLPPVPVVNANKNILTEVAVSESSKQMKGTSCAAAMPLPKGSTTTLTESFPLRLTTKIEGKEIDALVGPSYQYNQLIWLVKFKHRSRFDLVHSTLMNQHFTQNVIQFYERRIQCSTGKRSIKLKEYL